MYAARRDLVDRYGGRELDALDPADAGGGHPRSAAALADTRAEIDMMLHDGWALPLPAGPWPALTAVCCDLARLRLYDDEAPKRVVQAAASARRACGRSAPDACSCSTAGAAGPAPDARAADRGRAGAAPRPRRRPGGPGR